MKRLIVTWVVFLMVLMPGPPVSGQDTGSPAIPAPVPAAEWEHSHEGPYGEALLRVEEALRCNCGCNLDVHMCQYQMQCGTSPAWSQRILHALEAGDSEEAILAGFTAEFGPNALMTLPTEGFNWVAYLLPWIALVAGAGVVGMVLRRRGGIGTPEVTRPGVSEEGWSRVQEELQRLEDEERASDF